MVHLIRKRGFTLVELLVSIAIIATLTAILLPNFMGARERAKDAKAIQDMNAIKTALRSYYNDKQSYPVTSNTDIEETLKAGGYVPGVTGVGYTYTQTDNGDGFLLEAELNSNQGSANTDSQTRCGVTLADTLLYVVCAK